MLQIYDRVIPRQGIETLAALGLIVFIAVAFELALRAARHVLLSIGAERFELHAYHAAVSALLLADPARVDRVGQGKAFARFQAIERLRGLHVGESSVALLDLPFALVFLTVITLLSPAIGAAVVLLVAISFVFLRIARRPIAAQQAARRDVEARRHSFLVEVLSGIASVRNLQIEDFMKRRYERLLNSSASTTGLLAKRMQTAQGFVATVGMLAPFLVATIGAVMVIRHNMSLGTLAAIILLTGRIVQPILRVEAFLAGADDANQARKDLEALLSLPRRKEGKLSVSKVRTIELSDVQVSVGAGSQPDLKDLNLSLSTGDFLSVSAPTETAATAFLELLGG